MQSHTHTYIHTDAHACPRIQYIHIQAHIHIHICIHTHIHTSNSMRGKCRECALRGKEQKRCHGQCGQSLPMEHYTRRMWTAQDEERKCLKCMQRSKRGQGKCIECKDTKSVSEFSMHLLGRACKKKDASARCNECKQSQLNMQDILMQDIVMRQRTT